MCTCLHEAARSILLALCCIHPVRFVVDTLPERGSRADTPDAAPMSSAATEPEYQPPEYVYAPGELEALHAMQNGDDGASLLMDAPEEQLRQPPPALGCWQQLVAARRDDSPIHRPRTALALVFLTLCVFLVSVGVGGTVAVAARPLSLPPVAGSATLGGCPTPLTSMSARSIGPARATLPICGERGAPLCLVLPRESNARFRVSYLCRIGVLTPCSSFNLARSTATAAAITTYLSWLLLALSLCCSIDRCACFARVLLAPCNRCKEGALQTLAAAGSLCAVIAFAVALMAIDTFRDVTVVSCLKVSSLLIRAPRSCFLLIRCLLCACAFTQAASANYSYTHGAAFWSACLHFASFVSLHFPPVFAAIRSIPSSPDPLHVRVRVCRRRCLLVSTALLMAAFVASLSHFYERVAACAQWVRSGGSNGGNGGPR